MNLSLPPKLRILLAARPGPMRDALLSFLRSQPDLCIIAMTNDISTALDLAHQQIPDLVMVDTDFPGDSWLDLLENLPKEQPQTRYLVLAETLEQQQVALKAGASHAMLKGMPGEWLKQAILYGKGPL